MIKGLRHPSNDDEWLIELNGTLVQESIDKYIMNVIKTSPVDPTATAVFIAGTSVLLSICNLKITKERILSVLKQGIADDPTPVDPEELALMTDEYLETITENVYILISDGLTQMEEIF